MTAPSRRNGALVKHIYRGCLSKIRYPDQMTARAAGMYYGPRNNVTLYVYQCKFCGGWHLTKKRVSYKARCSYGLHGGN